MQAAGERGCDDEHAAGVAGAAEDLVAEALNPAPDVGEHEQMRGAIVRIGHGGLL